jgi:hypothetical protein
MNKKNKKNLNLWKIAKNKNKNKNNKIEKVNKFILI